LSFKCNNIDLEWVGEQALVNGNVCIKINPDFIRPFEKEEDLVGDNSKLKSIIWNRLYKN
jgi:GDP-D-mannose dehydratase